MKLIVLMVAFAAAAPSEFPTNTKGCTDPDSECVPYYMCDTSKAKSAVLDGLIDTIFNEGKESNQECENYIDVCCAKVDQIKPTPKASVGCGQRIIDGIGFRLTSDAENESQFGEFPWMAAILREKEISNVTSNIYQCGAALIHPEILLTAAQCVSDKPVESLKVRVGEWDTQTKLEIFPHQDISVAEVVMHKDFSVDPLANDIALVFLKSPAEVGENVGTICLPPTETSFDKKRCVITSWGKDKKDGKYSTILRKVELSLVPKEQCGPVLRGTQLGAKFDLHQSLICAGGEAGMDMCKGSEGSPLACAIDGKSGQYQLAGIYSKGIDCGDPVPNLYTSLAELRGWVDEQLASRTVNTSYYTV